MKKQASPLLFPTIGAKMRTIYLVKVSYLYD